MNSDRTFIRPSWFGARAGLLAALRPGPAGTEHGKQADQPFHIQKRCARCAAASLVLALIHAFPVPAAEGKPEFDRAGGYQGIIERNPFGLRPPPAAVAPPAATPAAASSELRLTGVSLLEGRSRAHLVRQAQPGPPRFFSLAEGHSEDGLEVLSISVSGGLVEVRDGGVRFVLSFEAQERADLAVLLDEERFNEEHALAHKLLEKQEGEREARELAEAAQAGESNSSLPTAPSPVNP